MLITFRGSMSRLPTAPAALASASGAQRTRRVRPRRRARRRADAPGTSSRAGAARRALQTRAHWQHFLQLVTMCASWCHARPGRARSCGRATSSSCSPSPPPAACSTRCSSRSTWAASRIGCQCCIVVALVLHVLGVVLDVLLAGGLLVLLVLLVLMLLAATALAALDVLCRLWRRDVGGRRGSVSLGRLPHGGHTMRLTYFQRRTPPTRWHGQARAEPRANTRRARPCGPG